MPCTVPRRPERRPPGPAEGHTRRACYTDTPSGLRWHSNHHNKVLFTLILREKSGDICEITTSGEKPLSEKEKARLSFATVWTMALKSNGSAEITDINSAYTLLSHQCALIKRDKNVHLEISL